MFSVLFDIIAREVLLLLIGRFISPSTDDLVQIHLIRIFISCNCIQQFHLKLLIARLI